MSETSVGYTLVASEHPYQQWHPKLVIDYSRPTPTPTATWTPTPTPTPQVFCLPLVMRDYWRPEFNELIRKDDQGLSVSIVRRASIVGGTPDDPRRDLDDFTKLPTVMPKGEEVYLLGEPEWGNSSLPGPASAGLRFLINLPPLDQAGAGIVKISLLFRLQSYDGISPPWHLDRDHFRIYLEDRGGGPGYSERLFDTHFLSKASGAWIKDTDWRQFTYTNTVDLSRTFDLYLYVYNSDPDWNSWAYVSDVSIRISPVPR